MAEPMTERRRDPRHLTVERVPLATLSTHPKNARRSDLPDLIESIRLHDFYTVVTAQLSTAHILVGNHRYQAQEAAAEHTNAQNAGWQAYAPGHFDDIDVKWVDCDDDEALRINAIDNPLGEAGTYDWPVLRDNLEVLVLTELGLAGTGYTPQDFDDIVRRVAPPDFDAIERAFGTAAATASSLWPAVRLVLEPTLHDRFVAWYAELPGEDDTTKITALLDLLA